jgi:hypothetical protein
MITLLKVRREYLRLVDNDTVFYFSNLYEKYLLLFGESKIWQNIIMVE